MLLDMLVTVTVMQVMTFLKIIVKKNNFINVKQFLENETLQTLENK